MLKKNISLPILISLVTFSGINGDDDEFRTPRIDWSMPGAGARALGLGGAFIAVANDATAMSWNPAGLAHLEIPEIALQTRATFHYRRGSESIYRNHSTLDFASFARPFRWKERDLSLVVSYHRQVDFSYYFTNFRLIYGDGWFEEPSHTRYYRSGSSNQYKESSRGGADTFSVGFGLKLSPHISVGSVTNIWFGKRKDQITNEYAGYFERYFADLQLEQSWTASRRTATNYNYSISGINYFFGILMDLAPILKSLPIMIGITLRTPFNLEGKHSRDSKGSYFRRDWNYEMVEPDISDLTDTRNQDYNYSLDMPLMLGLGGSYQPNNFMIAFDYETNRLGFHQSRVGVEYLLATSHGIIPIRMGIQTIPTALGPTNDWVTSGDQVVGSGLSIGTGYAWRRASIDLALTRRGYSANREETRDDVPYKVTTTIIILTWKYRLY